MQRTLTAPFDPSITEIENWSALGTGVLMLLTGASRRTLPGFCLTVAATPLVYRGVTGRWPRFLTEPPFGADAHGLAALDPQDTRTALAESRGIHVREAVRLEKPLEEVYAFWRKLDNLPRFMTYLESVTEHGGTRSTWVARGPGGVRVQWEAEIINEVPNQVIGWRSLEGSDIVTAGSINFDRVRQGSSTQVTVHFQYAPPAGVAGDRLAALFGRAPTQTVREDLRRLKQLLEAGEIAQASRDRTETAR